MQTLIMLTLAFAADGFAPARKSHSLLTKKSSTIIQDVEIDQTSPVVAPSSQLLVLDRHVDPRGVLLDTAKSTTTVVCYDSKEDTCIEVAALVAQARELNSVDGEFVPFETVALATHGGAQWELTKDLAIPMTGDKLGLILDAVSPMMSMLALCTDKDTGRVDLLGCSLLNCQPLLVEGLEERHGLNFCASDDYTGNLVGGGDWVLESDGIDVSGTYWDKVALADYQGIMWFSVMDALDFVPIVGTVARGVEGTVYLATGDTDSAMEAYANAGGNLVADVLTVSTGGIGYVTKVAKVGVKVGVKAGTKVIVKVGVKEGAKAAVKAAGKASMKLVRKKLTKVAVKNYAKKYMKKQIKGAAKEQIKVFYSDAKEVVREDLEALLADITGTAKSELELLSEDTLNDIASAVLDSPED